MIAASDPRTPPLRPDLRRIPRHGLVLAWWLAWVATMVRGNVGNPDLAADVQDVSDRVLGAAALLGCAPGAGRSAPSEAATRSFMAQVCRLP